MAMAAGVSSVPHAEVPVLPFHLPAPPAPSADAAGVLRHAKDLETRLPHKATAPLRSAGRQSDLLSWGCPESEVSRRAGG